MRTSQLPLEMDGAGDEVAGELAERALGADLDGFCLTFFDYQRDLTLFAERVIPVLREKLLERGVRLRLTLDEPGS